VLEAGGVGELPDEFRVGPGDAGGGGGGHDSGGSGGDHGGFGAGEFGEALADGGEFKGAGEVGPDAAGVDEGPDA